MKKPKLLHLALGVHNVNMQQMFDKHFDTRHLDWLPYQNNPLQLNQKARELFDKFKPDIMFFQLQRGDIISIPTTFMKFI